MTDHHESTTTTTTEEHNMTTTTTTTTPAGTTPATTTPAPYAGSVDAVRAAREGSDLWQIADALLAEVGQGEAREKFRAVVRACEENGVRPYSVSALRQYRDVAARWPVSDRIPGVSFSAHRAALPAPDPVQVLNDMVKRHGKDVPVRTVKDAATIAAHGIGAVTTTPAGTGTPDLKSATAYDLALELAARTSADTAGTVATIAADTTKARNLARDLATLVSAINAAVTTADKRAAVWAGTGTAPETATTAPETATAPVTRVTDQDAGTAAPKRRARGLR